MVKIVEVVSKAQMRAFATFPLKLYKGSKLYVPSFLSDEVNLLNAKKNPHLEYSDIRCFLAYKDGVVAGRVAAIIQHKFNEYKNVKHVRFSRFDVIDDLEVAKKLLEAVEEFGKQNNMQVCNGPWGFSDQDREGLLTFGFDKRATYATNYNYDYYEKLVTQCGYAQESQWVEYKFVVPEKNDERFARIAAHVAKKLKLKEIADSGSINKIVKNYGVEVLEMVNISYKDLDGYVPVTGKAMQGVLKQFGIIINPKFLSIIVDENDKVVGFGAALADICDPLIKSSGRLTLLTIFRLLKAIKKPKGLELALIAVLPEYQKLGVNSMVLSRIMGNIIENQISNVESNPELEHNTAVRSQWDTVEKELIKKRCTYQKNL